MTTADFPHLFLPGRVLHQSQVEMEVVVAGQKNYIQRDELLKLHPSDASAMGIEEADWVEVISASERIRAKAAITSDAFRGTVSATVLFGDLMTRLESSEDPDPMSHVPGLPVTMVRLAKLKA